MIETGASSMVSLQVVVEKRERELRELELVTKLMLAIISGRDSAPPSPKPKMSRTKRVSDWTDGVCSLQRWILSCQKINSVVQKNGWH
jgi:hypothetical protein